MGCVRRGGMGCACALRLCALRVGHRLRVPPRRSLICALWLRQVWRSSTAIDSFSIGYEPKQRRGDVRGALPRAEHGTVWRNIDCVVAFSVGFEPDAESDQDEEHDVCGLIPDTGKRELR